jgi:type VI secretion system secreted protein VgrG
LKVPYTKSDGTQIKSGGPYPAKFHLRYDSQNKTLVATARIKVVPVDLVRVGPNQTPILNPDGTKQSVPYDHFPHWVGVASGPGTLVTSNVLMEYRDSTGIDLTILKNKVESVLNRHHGLLILDGCSRGASCGRRVKVKFVVELILGLKSAALGDAHKKVWLFPKAQRADASSWGEQEFGYDRFGNVVWPSLMDGQVVPHECGHLFRFPDEYFAFGGFVHKKYIKNEELDFDAQEKMKNKAFWNMYSENNLMGGGCSKDWAAVKPHYLYYLRQYFSEMTGMSWNIGSTELVCDATYNLD